MKKRYDGVRVGEVPHEEIGLSEKSGLRLLCVRKKGGFFTVTNKCGVASVGVGR